jgi:hypothetical protein
MIGGLSSSIATAIRTASVARATMDDMSRQIATGQKVSSVKDDGAAWARAAGMKSQKVEWENRDLVLDRLDVGLAHTGATIDQFIAMADRMRDLLLAATGTIAGSSARRALQAEWVQTMDWASAGDLTNPTFPDWTGFVGSGPLGPGVNPAPADSYFAGQNMALWPQGANFASWLGGTSPVVLWGFDLTNATATQLDDARTSLDTVGGPSSMGYAYWWRIANASSQNRVDRMRPDVERNVDRLDAAIGSLTDADLGKASTARANAQTRQDLALATVRQAIATYGDYANGLLGAVARTQRGVLE